MQVAWLGLCIRENVVTKQRPIPTWGGKHYINPFASFISNNLQLKDMARYSGLLLAPAEGFRLRPRGFFALRAKKELIMLFWLILDHFDVQ